MTTLTRLAGMADVPDPTSNPNPNDLESQTPQPLSSRPSRASLPPSRRPSHRSLQGRPSTDNDHQQSIPPVPSLPRPDSRTSSAGGASATPSWGPSHPCFPHPNPHTTGGEDTRIVRVQRDWLVSGDAYPAIANLYPEILSEWVSESEFRDLITGINGRLKKTFAPDGARAVVDAVLGLATGFLWDDIGVSGVKRGVKELEGWMEGWNEERREKGNPVRLVPLRKTGFMNLDIQIPDPRIDFVDGEE